MVSHSLFLVYNQHNNLYHVFYLQFTYIYWSVILFVYTQTRTDTLYSHLQFTGITRSVILIFSSILHTPTDALSSHLQFTDLYRSLILFFWSIHNTNNNSYFVFSFTIHMQRWVRHTILLVYMQHNSFYFNSPASQGQSFSLSGLYSIQQ